MTTETKFTHVKISRTVYAIASAEPYGENGGTAYELTKGKKTRKTLIHNPRKSYYSFTLWSGQAGSKRGLPKPLYAEPEFFESLEASKAEEQNVLRFKVGQTYSTRSICDHDCIFSFTITKRTAKTVSFLKDGREVRKGLGIYDGKEQFSPHGSYSMSAVISADDKDLSGVNRQKVEEATRQATLKAQAKREAQTIAAPTKGERLAVKLDEFTLERMHGEIVATLRAAFVRDSYKGLGVMSTAKRFHSMMTEKGIEPTVADSLIQQAIEV